MAKCKWGLMLRSFRKPNEYCREGDLEIRDMPIQFSLI